MGLKEIATKFGGVSTDLETNFVKSIDRYLLNSLGGNRKLIKKIYPSNYYKCLRQIYYIYKTGKQQAEFPLGIRWTECGNITHEWIQNKIIMGMAKEGMLEVVSKYTQAGVNFINTMEGTSPLEVKFTTMNYTKNFPISAMVDGIVNFQNRLFIFEFKTTKDEKFNEIVETNEPIIDHYRQGALYSLCLKLPVMFLYYNKNNQKLKPLFVEYTDEQHEQVKQRLIDMDTALLLKELPEKDASDCTWCTFKTKCKKNLLY